MSDSLRIFASCLALLAVFEIVANTFWWGW